MGLPANCVFFLSLFTQLYIRTYKFDFVIVCGVGIFSAVPGCSVFVVCLEILQSPPPLVGGVVNSVSVTILGTCNV